MFNVFKRPMFKRGGPSKGTGIMSHVESKNIGGGVIKGEPMGSRTGFQSPFVPSYNINLGGGQPKGINIGTKGGLPRQNIPTGGLSQTAKGRFPFLNISTRAASVPSASTVGTLAFPTVGTGILAYLNRPKTYGELEFMKNNPPLEETASQEDYIEYEKARKEAAEADPRPIDFTDAFFLDPKTGTYPKFMGRTEDRPRRINEKINIPGTDMRGDPAQFAGEDELTDFNALAKEEEAKEKAAIAKAQAASEKDAKYTETDILSSVEDEKKILDQILPDNVSTSEKAFLIAEAMKGETLADKLDIAKSEGMKLAKTKSARDREKALLAYKGATQKDIAQIQAGKKGFSEKQFDKIVNAQKVLSNPKSTEEQKKRAQQTINTISSTMKVLSPSREGLTSADITIAQNIDKLVKKIQRLEPGSDKYNRTLENYYRAREVALASSPGLAKVIELADSQLGFETRKDGGRIGYALGSENPMVTRPTVGQVPTEQTSKLSFEDLRNRLPKEITDGIVRLIASSDQALQDFSYIRTQGDVVKFNQKYGVNLVLPAEA